MPMTLPLTYNILPFPCSHLNYNKKTDDTIYLAQQAEQVVAKMPSIRALSSFASSLLAQIPLFSEPSTFPATTPFNLGQTPTTFEHTCPIDSPVSCHNSTVAPDSCCFIYPGGQLLQTQFWDTGPSIGPGDSWTLHGLWYLHFPLHHSSKKRMAS